MTTVSWGIMDSALNTIVNSVLGFEFDSNITPFSVFKFVQSFFVFVFQVMESIIKGTERRRYWFIASFLFAMGALAVTTFFPFKGKELEEEEEDDRDD